MVLLFRTGKFSHNQYNIIVNKGLNQGRRKMFIPRGAVVVILQLPHK